MRTPLLLLWLLLAAHSVFGQPAIQRNFFTTNAAYSTASQGAKALGAYPNTFTPDMLPNLSLWLKADALSQAHGSVVTNWTDSSTNSRTATQSTNANRPIFNTNSLNYLPGVTFAPTKAMATPSFLDSSFDNVTIFYVGSRSTTNTGVSLFDDSGGYFLWASGENNASIDGSANGGVLVVSGVNLFSLVGKTTDNSTATIRTMRMNNGNCVLRINGVQCASGTSGQAGLVGALHLGGPDNDYGVNGISGDINEVIIFKGALSDADCRLVESYLANKWFGTPRAHMIFDGDSLTAGLGTTGNSKTYPYIIRQGFGVAKWDGENKGIGGVAAGTLLTNALAQVDPYLHTGEDIVFFDSGINELQVPINSDVVLGIVSNYCAARSHAGFRVVVATITPAATGSTPASFETNRLAFNGYLRSNWFRFAAALADVGGDPIMGVTNSLTNTTYYNSDKIHWTDTGTAIAAGIFSNAVAPLIISPTNVFVQSTNGTATGLTVASAQTNSYLTATRPVVTDANKALISGSLSVPSGFTVTAPLTVTAANTASNLFLAGPTNNGSAAAWTFRHIDITDLFNGTGASASTFLRGDGTWTTTAATGTNVLNALVQDSRPWTNSSTLLVGGLVGTTNNTLASAGIIGEYLESKIGSNTFTLSFTNNVAANVTTLTLTPGDWDVGGSISFSLLNSTVSSILGGIGTNSAAILSDGTGVNSIGSGAPSSTDLTITIPARRIAVTVNTTVYMVGRASFVAGGVGGYGFLAARRMR